MLWGMPSVLLDSAQPRPFRTSPPARRELGELPPVSDEVQAPRGVGLGASRAQAAYRGPWTLLNSTQHTLTATACPFQILT